MLKNLQMIKSATIIKKYKQQKAEKSEIKFIDFCKQRKIEHIQLDNVSSIFKRKKYLIKTNGKCPDFWCKKMNRKFLLR